VSVPPAKAIESAIKVVTPVILQDLCDARSNGLITERITQTTLSIARFLYCPVSKDEPAIKQWRLNQERIDYMVKWPHKNRVACACSFCILKAYHSTSCNDQRAYTLSEAIQRELTEKNCELRGSSQPKLEEAPRLVRYSFKRGGHEVTSTPWLGFSAWRISIRLEP